MENLENRIKKAIAQTNFFEDNQLEFELLHGDASARRYVRVSKQASNNSLVAMVLANEKARFSEEAMGGPEPEELPFINVQRYLANIGMLVPEIHFSDEQLGIILLQDLGDRTLGNEIKDGSADKLITCYQTAVDLLVELQLKTHRQNSRELAKDCIAFSRAFEFDLLRWELDHFIEYLVEIDRQTTFSSKDKETIDRSFDQIAKKIASWPREFVHRDFQSRNIMCVDDRLALIDFQDALLGPCVYDLVALLRDSYVVLRAEQIDLLIDRYLDNCYQADLARPDKETFRAQFDLQTVQRKLKDAGRFVFIDKVKNNPSFLPFIKPSLGYVAEALNRLSELHPLQDVLAQAVEELAR
jgi:aminoglycoside/choline kinase family phosphotransferase